MSELEDCKVKDVRVGVSWIGVWSRNLGVAKTYITARNKRVHRFMQLTELTALELAEYSYSWDLIEAGIGVAAINSLLNPIGERVNVFQLLKEACVGKNVVMVGLFPEKYVENLKNNAEKLYIVEMDPSLVDVDKGIYPVSASEYLIPDADIVIITASSLINKSIGRLLELSKNSYTALVGPTTPLTPTLFKYGIDILAGIKVNKPNKVIEGISRTPGMISKKIYGDAIDYLVLENRR